MPFSPAADVAAILTGEIATTATRNDNGQTLSGLFRENVEVRNYVGLDAQAAEIVYTVSTAALAASGGAAAAPGNGSIGTLLTVNGTLYHVTLAVPGDDGMTRLHLLETVATP